MAKMVQNQRDLSLLLAPHRNRSAPKQFRAQPPTPAAHLHSNGNAAATPIAFAAYQRHRTRICIEYINGIEDWCGVEIQNSMVWHHGSAPADIYTAPPHATGMRTAHPCCA